MARLLILGPGAEGGSLSTLLSKSHQVKITDSPPQSHGSFIEEARSKDVVFLWGDKSWGRVMADEIWHLLRNRLIVSLIPGLTLSELRDMYPLSKVARCKLCIDGATDKALFLFTVDASYSDRESAVLRMTAGASGEALFVPEGIFESLSSKIEASRAVIRDVMDTLKESMGGDRELYGFTLDWLLYGMGSAGIGGVNPPARSKHGEESNQAEMDALRAAVNQLLDSHRKEGSLGG
jgi:hypothetical protein